MKGKWKEAIVKEKEPLHLGYNVLKNLLKGFFLKINSKERVNWYTKMETFIGENLLKECLTDKAKYWQRIILSLDKWRKEWYKAKEA